MLYTSASYFAEAMQLLRTTSAYLTPLPVTRLATSWDDHHLCVFVLYFVVFTALWQCLLDQTQQWLATLIHTSTL